MILLIIGYIYDVIGLLDAMEGPTIGYATLVTAIPFITFYLSYFHYY